MKKVGAVLLDTRGIQKYVFASNKMKTNIGASYLVDTIFLTPVHQVLGEMNLKLPDSDWRVTEELQMVHDETITAEIAYIGGGNMLLFFRTEGNEVLSVCREFVSRWSEKLLVYTPGLQTGAAVDVFDLDDFQNSLNHMYKMLKENQSNIMPQVDLPYTGLSLECDYNNKTANVYSQIVKRHVSAEVDAKLRGAEYADDRLEERYGSLLKHNGKNVQFADDLNLLGYKEGESYICVIHIDGNNMGVKFSHCRDIQERKKLSIKVAEAVQTAFSELIQQIKIEFLEKSLYDKYLDMKKLRKENTITLPIRPIIIGGDDITFITPGRLGLQFADFFIRSANRQLLLTEEQRQYFESCAGKDGSQKVRINSHLSCCAGVAIVPEKYPFFRAYSLAEELCANAKKHSRQDDSSWLDFALLHGETYPSLDMLREKQYKGLPDPEGRSCLMHYGPYRIDMTVDAPEGIQKKSLRRLFALCADLQKTHKDINNGKNSINKIKKLREVLFRDRHTQEIFLENNNDMVNLLKKERAKEQQNPNGVDKDIEIKISSDDLWEKEEMEGNEVIITRFIDAIEIEDFIIPGLEGNVK